MGDLQTGRWSRASVQGDIAPYFEALFCDSSIGRRGGSASDPDSPGASQPEDHGEIPARFQLSRAVHRQPPRSALQSQRPGSGSMSAQALELADIFRTHGPAYLEAFGAS